MTKCSEDLVARQVVTKKAKTPDILLIAVKQIPSTMIALHLKTK